MSYNFVLYSPIVTCFRKITIKKRILSAKTLRVFSGSIKKDRLSTLLYLTSKKVVL